MAPCAFATKLDTSLTTTGVPLRRVPTALPSLLSTLILVPALFILPGCSGKEGGDDSSGDGDADTDTDTDTDSDSDTDTDADTDTDTDSDLVDIRSEMVTTSEGCETLGSTLVDGAHEYCWGEYHKSGSTWTGQEAIYYYANSTWKIHGGADCVEAWDTTATEIATGACSGCDLGLSVTATLNTTLTNCPDEMTSGDETFDAEYDVELADGGASSWYFAVSGTEFGAGYWISGGANYLSDSCAWF